MRRILEKINGRKQLFIHFEKYEERGEQMV